MKKIIMMLSLIGLLGLTACAYHSKQPTDDTYYKRTQGVAWPD